MKDRSCRLRWAVTLLCRVAAVTLLALPSGCTPILMLTDQNAFQTGRVLRYGQARVSCSNISYLPPIRGSIDLGLGNGWEAGAGFGHILLWGYSGELSVVRSVYTSRHFFSSALLEAELAGGVDNQLPLGRITAATAASYYPVEWFGIFAPLRLSMLFASPATFPYQYQVGYDSANHRPIYETRERRFDGLRDLVITPGIGISLEYKRVFARVAYNGPILGPDVETDSVTMGLDLFPYLGAQVGVKLF